MYTYKYLCLLVGQVRPLYTPKFLINSSLFFCSDFLLYVALSFQFLLHRLEVEFSYSFKNTVEASALEVPLIDHSPSFTPETLIR